MKSKHTRASLCLLALVMAFSVLAGCGGGNEPAPASDTATDPAPASTADETPAEDPAADPAPTADSGEGVTIVQWGWNSGEMEKIFDSYKEQSGVPHTLEYVAVQQAEAFQKLQTNVGAGLELPDIMPTEINQRGTMMSLDIWEDLSKEPYSFDMNTVFDYYKPLCTNEKGELVALPHDISTAGLAYKKRLAQEHLGTDDPAELQKLLPDWAAFKQAGIDLQSKTSGEVFMLACINDLWMMVEGQNPQPIVDGNTLNLAQTVKPALDIVVDFRDNKIMDNIVESSPAYNASFVDDTHIFYPCAGWVPDYRIIPNDPDGIDSWGLMVPPEGCFSWGGSGFMIPRDASHKQEGFDFVKWILSKEGAISQRETVMYNVGNKEAYDDPEFAQMKNSHFGDQDLGQILFVEAMPTIKVRPVSVHDVIIRDTRGLVIEAVNSDASLGVEGALEMFETEMRNKIPDLE